MDNESPCKQCARGRGGDDSCEDPCTLYLNWVRDNPVKEKV